MNIHLETQDQVRAFIIEDQDVSLSEYVMIRLDSGEYLLTYNMYENTWELRGDYRTLMYINAEGCLVSDELMRNIYGTANPQL